MNNIDSEYLALTQTGGWAELLGRTTISMRGADRQKLLHSFCTADIKSLAEGECCEAFVLNGKGKTIAHVLVLSLADHLLLSTTAGQAELLISHLDKYIIREDVTLENQSESTCSFFVCGEKVAASLFQLVTELPERNKVITQDVAGVVFHVANVEVAGCGYLVIAGIGNRDWFQQSLTESGLTTASPDALDLLRVERGMPWFGIDIDDRNLPQEVQRDSEAISFTKGCYLGQETVARIDAIGHVNQLLVRLVFSEGPLPVVGAELFSDEKSVGRVTSVAQIPAGAMLGLGYVKRSFAKPSVELKHEHGTAFVVA